MKLATPFILCSCGCMIIIATMRCYREIPIANRAEICVPLILLGLIIAFTGLFMASNPQKK